MRASAVSVLDVLLVWNLISVLQVLPVQAVFQPQLFQESRSSIVSQLTEFIGPFQVLEIPQVCSNSPLKQCHFSEFLYYLYHDMCFAERCEKKNYYCLNGNGFTLHICGTMPKCTRRFRNVAVSTSSSPGIVKVYSTPCPDGYVQFGATNCFNACLKDAAVVVVTNSTSTHMALGYCNYEDRYCHPNSSDVFEFGKEKDKCRSEDIRKCPEVLLPDCSCDTYCLQGQERSLETNFTCQRKTKVPIGGTSTVTVTSSLPTDTSPSLTQKPTDSESENNQRHSANGSTSILAVALVSVVAIVVFGIVAILVKLKCSLQGDSKETRGQDDSIELKEYHTVPASDNAEPAQNGSANTANGVHQVIKINKKKEDNRIYNTFNIHNGNGQCTKEDETSLHSIHDGEQQMQEMKSATLDVPDTGYASNEDTHVKRPY